MNMRTKLLVGIAVVLWCSLALLGQQRSVAVPPLRGGMIVTTDWLADHGRDPKLVVVHVGGDRTSYDEGHIPGARFVALGEIAVTRNGIPNELPTVGVLKNVFERLGVGDQSRVILYGDLHGLLAARAYWTLDYLGHGNNAALLDGGLEKWRAEQRPVTKNVPPVTPAGFTAKVNAHVMAELADVQRISDELIRGGSDSVLVDARPAEQFTGEQVGNGVKRGGHIPGAVSIPWTENIESTDDPELKPPPELRKRWKAAGATPGKHVVVYCQTGIQAAYTYFALRFLGYDVALYDGSFMEWISRKDAPVQSTGAPMSR